MPVETLYPTIHTQYKPLEKRAFDLEYKRPVNEYSLRDDIVSYLGEYRFKVPMYDYEIFYSKGLDGDFSLRDKYEGDSMTGKAVRAIKKNESTGGSSRREKAELLGIRALENQLEQSENGDVVLWASPPGPKEEGYGDYGYIYVGSVEEVSEKEKKVSMTAVRVENPSIDQFNFYLTLSSGLQTNFQSDTDFLSNPIILKSSLSNNGQILFDVFNFEYNSEAQRRFLETIEVLSPLINELIRLTQEGASYEERKKALNTLENLASHLNHPQGFKFKQKLQDLRALSFYEATKKFGHEPERVAGSCGASGVTKSKGILSNDIFSSLGDMNSMFENDDEKNDMFECPKCGYRTKRLGGTVCKCGYTLEDFKHDHPELVCE